MFAKSKSSTSSASSSRSSSSVAPDPSTELARRMARPQRHRLLHGYPMAPLLTPGGATNPPDIDARRSSSRPLLVGVLPHTFCNPSVKGCGFCTFPHEKHSNEAARITTSAVAREVRSTPRSFRTRKVPALYFGGGTANLTPPDVFRELANALEETFDLADAEVSLEGAPIYFLTRDEALLDILAAMRARHRRISLGIQTFDPQWIARMGRSAFGDASTFAAVVRTAHARGMTTSCDLLYNLPGGQSKADQIADVQKAIDLGFDQICIYNLVLDASIDSEWAHDRSLLTRVAKPTDACDRWLTLRDLLLLNGYRQTTLTNFERSSSSSNNRFLYERLSFDAATNDALGFGPGAISTVTTSGSTTRAIKWMNIDKSATYAAAIQANQPVIERSFEYTPTDLRLLHITRALSALEIDRARYLAFFGTDILEEEDFAAPIQAARSEGLLTIDDDFIALTPRGMFYADAVAGLIASRRARELRHPNDAIAYAMG